MIENREIELAFNFLQYTDRNIFLTGRAGTGKTTFLKSLTQRLHKRFVVLAPTGVAALNAGGVTIHSFFQLPFHVFVPGAKFETRKFSKQKRNLINSLDIIIIDEVSMVRCDVLDTIDRILRTFRRNGAGKPFGGVQLLLIGDLNQLPPIAKDDEELMLRPYYDSLYFFSSKALLASNYITIALKHIYRQSDEKFIQILNAVRDNKLTKEDVEVLNQSYRKDILENVPENYIVLCTHNIQADKINVNKINALKGKDKIYKAKVEGIFPDNIYPNLERLHLKVGAQVMFLKNDYETSGTKKRYYNGKIGVVTDLDDDFVTVKCPEDEQEILVQQYTWQNFEYSMEKDSKELKLKEKGTFTQFPLKLAWAITIHKSQGLTFDKAVINSNQAFSHGQVYVALSRCRSLEGMILSEPFKYSSIILDRNIKLFNDNAQKNLPDDLVLQKSKDDYFFKTLYSIFDFFELSRLLNKLQGFVNTISKVFPKLSKTISQQVNAYFKDIEEVAVKFKKYIDNVYNKDINSEEKAEIVLKRSYDARDYFLKKLTEFNDLILSLLDIDFDNKEDTSLLNELTVQISVEKEIKFRLLNFLFKDEFQIDEFLKYKNNILAQGTSIELSSIIGGKKKKKSKTSKSKKTEKPKENKAYEDVEDKDLFDTLRKWRKEIADEESKPAYMILSQVTLIEIANKKPQTIKELLEIRGIGKQKAERYGQTVLDIILDKNK